MDKKNISDQNCINRKSKIVNPKSYEVRFCRTREVAKLQQFIHDHWKEDHILSKDTKLLLYQHQTAGMDYLNFVVAVDNTTQEFIAVLGFIPTYQFDINLKPKDGAPGPDIWLAIWKKHKDHENVKGLGMDLYNYLLEYINPGSVAAIGINDQVEKLYQKLGFTTGELDHYYFLRKPINDELGIQFQLKIAKRRYSFKAIGHTTTADWESLKITDSIIPKKSIDYFTNKYGAHPTYTYFVALLMDEYANKAAAIFVFRKVHVRSNVLRIVDCAFADDFNYTGVDLSAQLNEVLHIHDCEYVDWVGSLMEVVTKGSFLGMTEKNSDEIIIPNYFEPFEQRNIPLKYAIKCYGERGDLRVLKYGIFKGDSDQDRPNTLMSKQQ